MCLWRVLLISWDIPGVMFGGCLEDVLLSSIGFLVDVWEMSCGFLSDV